MKTVDRIKQLFAREQFDPSFLGLFINPFYFARKGLHRNIREIGQQIQGKTLDVGCGRKPYRDIFRSTSYIGLEIDSPGTRQYSSADVFYPGGPFPFEDNEFDSVVTNQVFEHVFYPAEFLREIHRVLRPGGILLLTVPFVWDEHEQPRDFARYTSFALKNLFGREGFTILEARKSVCDIRVVFQLLNAYIYKSVNGSRGRLNLLATLLLTAPVNLIGEILSWVTPINEDLYLDNVILAVKTEIPTMTD